MNHLHADNAGFSANEETQAAGAHKDNVAPFQLPADHVEYPDASLEDVQKDLLKAIKRLDKAVESASEETGKAQGAYRELLSIITPSH